VSYVFIILKSISISTEQDSSKLANCVLDTEGFRLDNVIHARMTSAAVFAVIHYLPRLNVRKV
jgi:hypothetical protein